MRADRLVSILMLLQTRGHLTAAEVADELEVSERTARRDLDALAASGVPVYSVRGRGGGWRLAGGGRIDLTGLTSAEAQALFVLAGPRPASPELRAAVRKLARALPEPLRERALAASVAVFHDPQGWGDDRGEARRPALLETVENAVIDGRQLLVGYRDRAGNETSRRVHPLGVVAKGRSWYLVAGTDGGQRTFRVDRMATVEATDDPVDRPDDFVLADAWRRVTDRLDELRLPLAASVRVAPHAMRWMRWTFGVRMSVGGPGDDGRVEAEVRGPDTAAVARDLAPFGHLVEVVAPDEVRVELGRIGRELTELYPVSR